MKSRSALSFLVLSFFLVQGASAKSPQDHWKGTGLVYATIEKMVTTQTCYDQERSFLACVMTLNEILAFSKTKQVLVSLTRTKIESGFGAVVKDFGALVAVGPKDLEVEDFAEAYEATKKEKKLVNDSLVTLYKDTEKNHLNFENIVAYARAEVDLKEKESLITGYAMNTFLGVMSDPHSTYMPKSMFEEEVKEAVPFAGIGASIKRLNKDGNTLYVIQQPLEGSPALRAGVKANDVIKTVDGVAVDSMEMEAMINKIKGPKGTEVKIGFQRGTETLNLAIVRDLIEEKKVKEKLVGPKSNYAYLKFSDFMMSGPPDLRGMPTPIVYDKVKEGLEKVVGNAEGIILDLRDNPGGYLPEAVRVAGLFLKKRSLVVSTQDMHGPNRDFFLTNSDPYTQLPLVVLINARSASASEIVSGALQDNQRGFIVGERSFGKGTVQHQFALPGTNLVARETRQYFLLPSGRTNQINGVVPDIEAFTNPNPSKNDKVAFREEDEYQALPPPLGEKWAQPRPEVVSTLQECVNRGSAKKAYEAASNDAIPPDYQLLVAEDTLGCVVSMKLYSPEMETPHFAIPQPKRSRSLAPYVVPLLLRLVPGLPALPQVAPKISDE